MGESPSQRRRNAYYRGGNPDHNPAYTTSDWAKRFRRPDWLEGWNEAKRADELAQKREQEETE